MASGDTLCIFTALHGEPPTSNYATLDVRNQIPVLDFNDTLDESIVFGGVMPRNYDGGGITITLGWMATDTTDDSQSVVWNTALMRCEAETDDLDTDSFATAQAVTDEEGPGSGKLAYSESTHTNGAQMDNVAEGEYFRLRVTRDANNGSDDLTGDAELVFVEIKET